MKKIALVAAILSVLGMTETALASQKDSKYLYEPVVIACKGEGATFNEALKKASEQCGKTVREILKTDRIDWYSLKKKTFTVRIEKGRFILIEKMTVGVMGLVDYDYELPKKG